LVKIKCLPSKLKAERRNCQFLPDTATIVSSSQR